MSRARKSAARARAGFRRARDAMLLTQAAAETIGHRGTLIHAAFASPAAWANPELSRMVYEKVFAANAAGWAMSRHAFVLQRLCIESAFQMTRSFLHASPLWFGASPDLLLRMGDAMAAAADAGARPIRRVARANARRLRARH